jgi:hypothetical protein
MLLLATNRFAEAEPLMRRALAIDEKTLGPDDKTVAVRLNNLALLLQSTTRFGEAELLYRRALAIREKNFGPNHPSVGIALTNLALLLKTMNRVAEADSLIRRASTLREQQNEPNPPELSRSSEPDRPLELAKAPDRSPVAAVPVAPPEKKPVDSSIERATSPADAAIMRATLATDGRAQANQPEEQPVQAPRLEDSAIATSQKEIEERPSEQVAALADVADMRAPLASDVPAATPQNKPEEQPTERVASTIARALVADDAAVAAQKEVEHRPPDTVIVQATTAASVPVAPSDRKLEAQPVERTKRWTEAAVVAGIQQRSKKVQLNQTKFPPTRPLRETRSPLVHAGAPVSLAVVVARAPVLAALV